jgi:hypothetical protein
VVWVGAEDPLFKVRQAGGRRGGKRARRGKAARQGSVSGAGIKGGGKAYARRPSLTPCPDPTARPHCLPPVQLYTSGSTGKPKGVLHTTAGYMCGAASTFHYAFDHRAGDVYWCTADCGWITGAWMVGHGEEGGRRVKAGLQQQQPQAPVVSPWLGCEAWYAPGCIPACLPRTASNPCCHPVRPVCPSAGHTYVAFGPLLMGARQVLFEGVPTFPDAGRCWEVVDKYQVGGTGAWGYRASA